MQKEGLFASVVAGGLYHMTLRCFSRRPCTAVSTPVGSLGSLLKAFSRERGHKDRPAKAPDVWTHSCAG